MRRIDFDGLSTPYAASYEQDSNAWGGLGLIFPPAAIPLLILLLIVAPIVLLTAESLFVPLLHWAQYHMMSPATDTTYGDLPSYFFIKLGAFVILSFLGCFQLILRIKSIYFTTWSRLFPRPHSLHVDYQRDTNRAMVALIQWKLYQVAFILLPPLLLTTFTAIVGLVELYIFNTFSDITFIAMSVQLTIELFLIMMLGLFTVFAYFNSAWTALTSLFGDVVAVTEPDLANSIILQRCGRIAFSTPWVYVLFPCYLILVILVIGEITWLIEAVDIHEFISLQANIGGIFLLEVLTLAAYLGFNFFKFYTYHVGLTNYYRKLPPQLKECFSPPP